MQLDEVCLGWFQFERICAGEHNALVVHVLAQCRIFLLVVLRRGEYSDGTMKQLLFLAGGCLCACFCVGCAPAAATASTAVKPAPAPTTKPPAGFSKTIVLWPAGAPGAVGTEDADVPKMFVYPAPGVGIRTAVIVMPGGGYTHLAIEKEGGAEARWLNEHGVTAFVLEYRLCPRDHVPFPM